MKIKGFALVEVMIIFAIVGFFLALIIPEFIVTKKAHKLGMTINEYREYQKTNKDKEESNRLHSIEKESKNKLWK